MKTIALEQRVSDGDDIVEPCDSKLFVGMGDTNIKLKSVHVFSKGNALEATALLIPDPAAPEGVLRAFPLAAMSSLKTIRAFTPAEFFYVKVENPTDMRLAARVVARAAVPIDSVVEEGHEDGFVALWPQPVMQRHIRVPAKGHVDCQLQFPFPCRVVRITTRSDSALDVSFQAFRMANVSFLQGTGVPVEFFYGGLDIKTFQANPANRMSATIANSSDEDRYVEIDVGIEDAGYDGDAGPKGSRTTKERSAAS
jgi:hypothetical protein